MIKIKSIITFLGAILISFLFVSKVSAAGFTESGYNYTARVFNGIALDWCMDKVDDESWCNNYLGDYANDKIVMKWNAEWDRGNDERWSNPPYDAWENNEWNGMFPGGSGAVWHYKIVWIGDYVAHPTLVPEGAYGIWGQFAVLMDQGVDPLYGPGHFWFAHGLPNGYGAY